MPATDETDVGDGGFREKKRGWNQAGCENEGWRMDGCLQVCGLQMKNVAFWSRTWDTGN